MLTLPATIRPVTLLLCLKAQQHMRTCKLLLESTHAFIDPNNHERIESNGKKSIIQWFSTWSNLFLHEMTNTNSHLDESEEI